MSRALRGADPTSIRHWNECAVVDVLRLRGVQRISDLREATGITAGPLGHVLRGLEQKRWVRSARGEFSGPGRPAQVFELTRPDGVVLGVALTSTQIDATVSDLDGAVINRLSRPFDPDQEDDAACDQIADIAEAILQDVPCDKVWAATIAMDVTLGQDATIVAAEQFRTLIGCRPLSRIQRVLPVPLELVSRMAALLTVEQHSGVASGVGDVLLVDPREPIAIGAGAAGRPLRGAHRVSSTLPMPLTRPEGESCPVTGMPEDLLAAIETDIRSWSCSLAAIIGILDPQAIVVRGIPTDLTDQVLEILHRELEAEVHDLPTLHASPLGPESAADGAALLAQRRVQETMISTDYGAVPFSREQFLMRAVPAAD